MDKPAVKAISAEIDSIEALIKLQYQKLENLGKLRNELLSSSKSGITSSSTEARFEDKKYNFEAIPFSLPPVPTLARDAIDSSIRNVLGEQAKILTDFEIIDAKIFFVRDGSKKKVASFEPVIAVIDTNGALHVYNFAAEKLYMQHLGHHLAITSLTMDSSDPRFSVLVTAAEDGSVHLTRITRSAKDKQISAHIETKFSIRALERKDSAETESLDSIRTITQPFATSLLTTNKSSRGNGHVIYVGDSIGRLFKFSSAGKEQSVLTDPSAAEVRETPRDSEAMPETWANPVADLAWSGNNLALARSNRLQIVTLAQFKYHKMKCDLPEPIVSLRFDERIVWHVIATLRSGAVVVVNLKLPPPNTKVDSSNFVPCDIVTVSEPAASPDRDVRNGDQSIAALVKPKTIQADGSLGTTKGFFLATSACTLQVHNASQSTKPEVEVSLVGSTSFSGLGCWTPQGAAELNNSAIAAGDCGVDATAAASAPTPGGLFKFIKQDSKDSDKAKKQQQQCSQLQAPSKGFSGLRLDVAATPDALGKSKSFLSFLLPEMPTPPKPVSVLVAYNGPQSAERGAGATVVVFQSQLKYIEVQKLDYVYYLRLIVIAVIIPLMLYFKFYRKNSRLPRSPAGPISRRRGGPGLGPAGGGMLGGSRAGAGGRPTARRAGNPDVDLDAVRNMVAGVQNKRQSIDKLYSEIGKLSTKIESLGDADDSGSDD